MIYIDNISGITEVYLGNQSISEVYSYQQKVWPSSAPPTTYKWLATYADSHIESAECDSTSAITSGEINLTNLVSVEIGDCVTSIGAWAFYNCTSLTSCTIGSGVTSIGDYAFISCTGLTSIDIPSGVTNIGNYALGGCTSLTSIDIPSGVTNIGNYAFSNCSGLTSITVKTTTPPTLGSNAFLNTNECPIYVPCQSIEAYKTAWSAYEARIQCVTPPTPYTEQYFTTEILGEVSPTTLINLNRPSGITSEVSYSLDSGATWTPYTTSITSFSTGDKVMWKGHVISQTEQTAYGSYGKFHIGTAYKVYGNVMSLLYDDNFADKTTLEYPHIFWKLLSSSRTLTSIEGLVLPATTLSNYCYEEMFYGCSGLTSVPTDLLPATTLADHCYEEMFYGCSGLTTVPSDLLPATTLARDCYQGMFSECTRLTAMPELPAKTLVAYCYANMFARCSSLNEVTCLASDISALGCTNHWLENVASSGTFKCPSTTEWTSGDSGIPSGWTRVNI